MSLLMAGFAFTACGGGESESTESTAPAEATAPATDTTAAPAADSTVRDSASTRPVTPGN